MTIFRIVALESPNDLVCIKLEYETEYKSSLEKEYVEALKIVEGDLIESRYLVALSRLADKVRIGDKIHEDRALIKYWVSFCASLRHAE